MSWNKHSTLIFLSLAIVSGAGVWASAANAPAPGARPAVSNGCRACHGTLDDDRLSSPALLAETDKHASLGVGCADCHGGNPEATTVVEAHDLKAGFLGVPSVGDIPTLCAKCHSNPEYMRTQNPSLSTDQLDKYWTSRHGQLLKMGLRKVAQCASCHSAHNVRPATDPLSSVYPANIPRTCAHCHADPGYMSGFPIPTDQYSKYAGSVHGKAMLEKEDLGAPACNDCHGNHGAQPPDAESLAHVCGLCHASNAELFQKSPHAAPFALQELPQCVVCHGYHDIARPSHEAFAMEAGSPCIGCHKPGDPGYEEGTKMEGLVTGILKARDEAERALDHAQNLGMDVEDGRFLLQDMRKNQLLLRTLSHRLDPKEFETKANEAMTQATSARTIAIEADRQFHFRRKGLLVSLFLSLPVLALLYLKIRQIEAARPH